MNFNGTNEAHIIHMHKCPDHNLFLYGQCKFLPCALIEPTTDSITAMNQSRDRCANAWSVKLIFTYYLFFYKFPSIFTVIL